MASYGLIMNQIALDRESYVWGCGQDIRRFNGDTWEYYDYTNSAVPSGFPYFLDTRSIDIDKDDFLWCGVAQGPVAGLNEFAVFSIDTNDVSIGKNWKFSDLGVFNEPQEISLVYACPFGDDILAFSTPLNGIGGTGTTGYTEINGVTGGRLFYYLKEIDKWQETVPGYTWPHIYDIKAKGYEGKDYFYYVATSEGLFIMPQGTQEVQYLRGVGEIIEQVEVYNTKTSEILSDNIYSIDLDEDGNLWIGTDQGLSFFNGKKFWNFTNSFFFPDGETESFTGPVTKVVSRPNGHVFLTFGDGELRQGSGFWHFNGTTLDRFTDGTGIPSSSQTYIENNDVLDIKLIKNNVKQGSLTLYENSLWVLCYNALSSFNYDQPHIYASSKHAGATGWNFTYFNETAGLNNIPLPKVNKYTWSYPEWRVYQDDYLASRFPGLDERNLFLTTKLSDIADGRAGKQEYWNNWPIETFDDKQESNLIQSTYFRDIITLTQLSPLNTSGSINVTCSTSIKTRNGIKYYLGGFLTGNVEANFGYDSVGNVASIRNLNPTFGGSINYSNYPSNSRDGNTMGFVVSYSEYGSVEAIIPFRGYRTYVQDIAPSEDDNFVAVSGYFSRYIEDGPYIWDSLESENVLRGGPTGAPAGLTNVNYYNENSTEFPWVSANNTIGTGVWEYMLSSPPTDPGFYVDLGPNSLLENIEYFVFNYGDINGDQTSMLQTLVTGNVIDITDGSFNTSYIISDIENLSNLSGLKFFVEYATGTTGPFPLDDGETGNFTFNETKIGVFPGIRGINSRTQYWNTNRILCNSPFVAKIGRDLGSVTSFSGLGGNGSDYISDVRKSYRGLGFRHFPAKYMSTRGDIKETKLDVTKYSIDLTVKSAVNLSSNRSVIKTADVSTLKNLWNRTNDGYYTSDVILGTTYPISQTWSSDSVLSYVRLSSDDLSLMATINSTTSRIGSSTQSIKNIGSCKSMNNDSSTIITGNSNRTFTMGGVYFPSTTESVYEQFYLIVDNRGVGIAGGYLGGKSGNSFIPKATNNQSMYYLTTTFGESGNYFGNNFVADSALKTYFLTVGLTEQGTPKTYFESSFNLSSSVTSLSDVQLSLSDQYYISYKKSSRNFIDPPFNYVSKTDLSGRVLSTINFGSASINTFTMTSDDDGNLFMGGYYSNPSTDADGDSYIFIENGTGFGVLSKRYKADLGINMGQIISRPGSGAWTWCDVHSTDSGMQIPLMTTVVFNNYASNIYGKKNNKWILSNSITEDEILNVKDTPYFIYTFTVPGNYTIYNSVEDAAGNVYVRTNPGYIEVINHKQKNPDDRRPDFVNSFDYGEPEVFPGRDYQVDKLSKDLAEEQAAILRSETIPFSSGFIVYNNPDATFRKDG
jgi:hypothetical protein